jgi:hypothetical protein
MKVIGIDNNDNHLRLITIGKIYDVEGHDRDCYYIKCDSGFTVLYLKRYFLTLDEYRNKKLEDIGI